MRFTQGFSDSHFAAQGADAERSRATKGGQRPQRESSERLLRAPPNPRDAKLSTLGTAWLDRLPYSLKPVSLAHRYPRIANRLALCWDDRVLTAKVLRELLEDRRGNRRGFPPEVKRELLALGERVARYTTS